jgi:hypothetical protein
MWRKLSSQVRLLALFPSDLDDDAVVHAAIVGQADTLCTLNRHFFHPDVVEYCRERGVVVTRDVDLLDLLRTPSS